MTGKLNTTANHGRGHHHHQSGVHHSSAVNRRRRMYIYTQRGRRCFNPAPSYPYPWTSVLIQNTEVHALPYTEPHWLPSTPSPLEMK